MIRDRHKNYFYVTIFASLTVTVLYCMAVYRWWPWIDTGICRIDACMVKKETLARGIGERPKIVFGGGSGTLYGVRAKDVQRAFGVPAVNMALHAGLEIDYIFYRLKRVLGKGDIVILPLEYEHLVYAGKISSVKTSFVASCDREYFLVLPWHSRAEYVFSLIDFNKVLKLLKRKWASRNARDTGNCAVALNQNGDVTSNVGEAPEFGLVGPQPLQQSGFTETYGLALIKEFSRWCKARGILFYVTYANSVYLEDYEDERYRTYFEGLQNYFTKNGIGLIGKPYDFFFPLRFFYDTAYHLNQDGVTLRTEQLIAMMRKMNLVPRSQR
jgi:hypothetical protein